MRTRRQVGAVLVPRSRRSIKLSSVRLSEVVLVRESEA
uniref:Uncharacterized protein n=1 Tax=Arundo donax TaxID=35708 RepID=A0A0A9GKT4_ARUDO